MTNVPWTPAQAPAQAPRRRGKGTLAVGAVLMLLGLVLGAVLSAVFLSRAVGAVLDFSTFTVPGQTVTTLDPGEKAEIWVFGPAGRQSAIEVLVVGPSGIVAVDRSPYGGAGASTGDAGLYGVFEAGTGGDYRTVASNTADPVGGITTVAVGPAALGPLLDSGWVVPVGLGVAGLLVVVGLVMMVVGIVRYFSSGPRRGPPAQGQPAWNQPQAGWPGAAPPPGQWSAGGPPPGGWPGGAMAPQQAWPAPVPAPLAPAPPAPGAFAHPSAPVPGYPVAGQQHDPAHETQPIPAYPPPTRPLPTGDGQAEAPPASPSS